ncbi:MAG: TIGR01212 family radical SAM protein, partial [Planctomycetia bacterium]|nr:TIGR01212 family radical SAM protein [Planctomycetia bacterium]
VEQYTELAADFIEQLPPDMVIDRVSGEMSEEYLLAPAWTSQKHTARNALNAVLTRRDSWQGKYFTANAPTQ